VDNLRAWVRAGVWFLPVCGVLTFFATLTHQPNLQTQFEAWSRYVTTDQFLFSHIFGSIVGAATAILGITGLAIFLAVTRKSGLAAAGLVTGVLGNVLVTAVFGIAASAQPAMGRAFLSGTVSMQQFYDEVYGPPVMILAGVGTLLYSLSFVFLGWSAASSGRLPKAAGIGFALAGPLIGIVGLFIGVAQTVGSTLLIVTGFLIARAVGKQ
jgi:hypothetical protein